MVEVNITPAGWILMALSLSTAANGFYMLWYLRKNHNEVWREIGGPSLLGGVHPRYALEYLGFFLGPRYKSLYDPHLTICMWCLRCQLLIGFILFFYVQDHLR